MQRGKINNRDRRQQIIDYSGLRYKNITPTDIDGVCEFIQATGFFEIRNKVYVFIEIKYKGKEIDEGQEKAFRRIVDEIRKPAIFIIADHEVENPEEDIQAHECIVRNYYWKRECIKPKREVALKEFIHSFLTYNKLTEYVDDSFDL